MLAARLSLLLFFIFPFFVISSTFEQDFDEANKSYRQAAASDLFKQQQVHFNRALSLYLNLEKKWKNPSSQLYLATAYTCLHLNEKSLALLYIEKALKIDPFSREINATKEWLLKDLKLQKKTDSLGKKLLKIIEKFYLFLTQIKSLTILLSAAILFYSLLFWFDYSWLSQGRFFSLLLFIVLLLTRLLNWYIGPVEAILIHPTLCYSFPNAMDTQADPPLLVAGLKVTILDMDTKGEWVKIKDENEVIGYISIEKLRLI